VESLIGQTLGQYQIVEQVGKGGMATVFKAYQPGLDRYVAIKVLPAYYAHEEGFSARFVREARAIARLDHPHILPVHDFGQSDGLTYIVMKYVAGGTLKDRLGQPLTVKETLGILKQVAAALDHAHDLGILHRDVKPGNILIDDKGWVYLSDFGLAKMVEGSVQLTGTGVGVGTPAYMSPEQGQGLHVDERTDVYSMGIILYEMLTGRVPYEAETPMAVVVKHITSPLPLPRSINPAIPERVERVILKALAKDPNDRFARTGELVNALEAAVAQSEQAPVDASPVPETQLDPLLTSPAAQPAAAPAPSHRVSARAKRSSPPLLAIAAIAGVLVFVGTVLVAALIFLVGRNAASRGQTDAGTGGPVTAVALASSTQPAVAVAPTDTPTAIPPAVTEAAAPAPEGTKTATATSVASATRIPTATSSPTSAPLATNTALPVSTPVPTFTPLLPTLTPTSILLRGRLVFYRNPGSHDLNDNEIYTYDIQPGISARLTNNAFNDWIPRWSPDGQRIAFTSNRDNDNPQNYDVWVVNADGSNPQRYIATQAWDEYPAWSPLNNGEIAISTTADNNSEIHVGTGNNLRRLTFNAVRDEWPTWSPDGKRIAHSNYQFGKGDIFVTDVSTDATQWLYGTDGDDNQPAWSPDGRWIVFVQRSDSKDAFGELVLISADGSSPSTLTPAYATTPAWSPDSQWIVFARGLDSNGNDELDEKDETDLWAIERASGTLVPLVQAPGADAAPSWTY
jgi:Tol biopolymer transport system component/tRNA A-37 threonylcarbamoyl transferase component Bud32